MSLLHSLDIALFRFINGTLSNPVFDKLMPLISGNAFFLPALIVCAVAIFWKGGKRGRVFVLLALIIVGIGDGWICNSIKEAVGRPRPFVEMPDANMLAGRGKSNSMPSSHAANWFAATMVAFIYYRRSWRFMLPVAVFISFSRIYNGVHYPSDVLAGAILGAGYAAAFLWIFNASWRFIAQRWFPLWWQRMPSLVYPDQPLDIQFEESPALRNQHWLRLGYVFIFALLTFRLFYIASDTIQLSEDEAYQWVWSKHPALSYFSKPPMIAYTQLAGTTLWGDTQFGVRFFSPVIAAILSILLLRFLAREVNPRAGLALIAILSTTPLTSVGATLMTIDPLSVLFWTAAMLIGWRAVQPDGTTRHWLWVGLWMGLGFLSKYTNLFQFLSWALFFLLWPPARKHLSRPGPYLALLVVVLSLTPVLVWNAQNGWITVEHVADNGGLGKVWKPTLRYTAEFLGAEAGLLNPIFFIGTIWAGIAFWRTHRTNPLLLFLFSMGAPIFLFYFLFTFRSRVFPNWIAPSVVPLFCLMVVHFYSTWESRRRWFKRFFVFGISFGLFTVVFLHDTDLVDELFQRKLPAQIDPLRRVRGWSETAKIVEQSRQKLAESGQPAFIIGDHYGITGELSFYIPEANEKVRTEPLVFYRSTATPKNQFYFWPGYESRIGHNAIYVQQLSLPKLKNGWLKKWLAGEKKLPESEIKSKAVPRELQEQFESITDLGTHEIRSHKRIIGRVQLYECRNLLEATR